MEKISLQHLQALIKENLGHYIDLDIDQIFLFEISDRQYIGTSTVNPKQGYPGIILGEITKDSLFLFPSILQYIAINSRLTISNKVKLMDLSHGNSISVQSLDGYYLAEDGSKCLVAFGQIVANRFTPIIDLGIYLRFESQ